MALVFISYRRDDSAGYAGRLHESLERRLGEGAVFRDVDALQPGQDFVDVIADRLRACRACLVLIGRDWLNATDASGRRRLDQESDYVRIEIAAALARPEVAVIPVLVEGAAMPAAEALPEPIRALARRHATSLRDEAWDSDVDRLAAAVRRSAGIASQPAPSPGVRRPAAILKWGLFAAAVIAVFLLFRMFAGGEDERAATPLPPPMETVEGVSATPAGAATGSASAIAMPRLPEAADGSLIYTLLSGDVARRGAGRLLRLRVRLTNDGAYPANFWDASFRLAAAGQVLEPISGLNEIVEGRAVKQGIVSFDVPGDVATATLRVLGSGMAAELPLDLKPTSGASAVDAADTRDPLSSAEIVTLVRDARPLGSGNEISYTLASMSARRFVNTLRITVSLRVTNRGRYPILFGSDAARLLADGQATAPIEGPNEAVAPGATAAADFVFDVPTATRSVVLGVTGGSSTTVQLDPS
jgi:hypothetical protein